MAGKEPIVVFLILISVLAIVATTQNKQFLEFIGSSDQVATSLTLTVSSPHSCQGLLTPAGVCIGAAYVNSGGSYFKVGQTVTFSGQLTCTRIPAVCNTFPLSGNSISILVEAAATLQGVDLWRTTVTTGSNGIYSFSWTILASNLNGLGMDAFQYFVDATFSGPPTSGYSSTEIVLAVATSSSPATKYTTAITDLHLEPRQSSYNVGQSVNIGGKLTCSGSGCSVVSVPVRIEMCGVNTASPTTGSDGSLFGTSTIISTCGTTSGTLKAFFDGNDHLLATSAQYTFQISTQQVTPDVFGITMALSPSPPYAPGQSFTISGKVTCTGVCTVLAVVVPNADVSLTLSSGWTGTVKTDANGQYSKLFVLPINVQAGSYSITATYRGKTASTSFNVQGTPIPEFPIPFACLMITLFVALFVLKRKTLKVNRAVQ